MSQSTRPSLFERLRVGLEEGIEQARGETTLRVTRITLPAPPPLYRPEEVRGLRNRLQLSQRDFANLLAVSPKTVQSWEQGLRVPRYSSARLLQFLDDPALLAGVVDASLSNNASA